MNRFVSHGRRRTWLFVVAAVVASLTVVPAAGAAPDVTARGGIDAGERAPRNHVEELRLRCSLDIVGDQRGVVCRWSESPRDGLRGYQLYRIVNGSARELVATVPAEGRRGAFDTDISAGDHLIYGVVARNGGGDVIGIGGPVRVNVPAVVD